MAAYIALPNKQEGMGSCIIEYLCGNSIVCECSEVTDLIATAFLTH
jgi:hypothetical protein